jgi:hypothetical protein
MNRQTYGQVFYQHLINIILGADGYHKQMGLTKILLTQ